MLVLLSPAKKLDWSARATPRALSEPAFQKDAIVLAEAARKLGADGLKKLMKISDKLAALNFERFENFAASPEAEATRPAINAFAGDTYTGLDAVSLDADALDWAEGHLRILSGLYGLLRPFDAMQPYRLEMGSKLATGRGGSLYDYWGSEIAGALNKATQDAGVDVIVNCASHEYFSAVDRVALHPRVISPVFKEMPEGQEPRIVSFYAKKARGAMARFILENRLRNPEALRDFSTGGYEYLPQLSEPDQPVFVRAVL